MGAWIDGARRAALGAGLILVATSAAAASPAFKQSYADALDAIEAGALERAELLLEAAIANEPEPREKIRAFGMRFLPYIPHAALGIVRFEQGDCDGAVAAWRVSASHGIAQATGDWPAVVDGMTSCGLTVAPELREPAPMPRQAVIRAGGTSAFDHYLRGLDLLDARMPDQAEQAFVAAARIDPRAVEKRRFFGMRFMPYVPYYYLSVARLSLGQCAAAAAAWRASAESGVAEAVGLAEGFEEALADCTPTIADGG